MEMYENLTTLNRLAHRIVLDYVRENGIYMRELSALEVANSEDYFRDMLDGKGIVQLLVENMVKELVSLSGGVKDA